jgi:hypothetical protein
MMEAARTSETFVNFYQTTRRYNRDSDSIGDTEPNNNKSEVMDEKFTPESVCFGTGVRHSTHTQPGHIANGHQDMTRLYFLFPFDYAVAYTVV